MGSELNPWPSACHLNSLPTELIEIGVKLVRLARGRDYLSVLTCYKLISVQCVSRLPNKRKEVIAWFSWKPLTETVRNGSQACQAIKRIDWSMPSERMHEEISENWCFYDKGGMGWLLYFLVSHLPPPFPFPPPFSSIPSSFLKSFHFYSQFSR